MTLTARSSTTRTIKIRTADKLLIVAVVGLIIRLLFAWHLPFTFDEGAYLYDAKLLAHLQLPVGDVLTKTPSFILLVAASVKVFGPRLWLARAVSIVASVLTAAALYVLGRQMYSRSVGIMASSLWLVSAGPIVLTTYGTTHSVALSLATANLALWVLAPRAAKYAWSAGVCLALAYAARKAMIAAIIPMAVIWFVQVRSKKALLMAGSGALVIGVVWLGSMYALYGLTGLAEASGLGYGRIAQTYLVHPDTIPMWGGGLKQVGYVALLYLTPLIILAAWGRRSNHIPLAYAVSGLWLVTTLALYSSWPALLPEYLADVLPPLVLLAALGIERLLTPRSLLNLTILSVLMVCNLASLVVTWRQPWTGWYSADAIKQVAQLLVAQVPVNEPVLTAAAIIPYVSGHQLYRQISHPLWYRYHFIATETRQSFLPEMSIIQKDFALGHIRWVLTDSLTNYAYFSRYLPSPDKQPGQWLPVAPIPNTVDKAKNPLQLWQHL